ncbi:MAG: cupredoxin domain-containing protein [Armatimonadetes bacterium]|nr:cupredoxin domain-containing protein [Armatimonadota bacterium]
MRRFLLVWVLLIVITPGGLGAAPSSEQVHRIAVTDRGFVPQEVRVEPGRPVKLIFRRESANTCATSVQMPGVLAQAVPLPLKKDVAVQFTPREERRLRFGCGMNMMIHGEVLVGESSPSPESHEDSKGCGGCGH